MLRREQCCEAAKKKPLTQRSRSEADGAAAIRRCGSVYTGPFHTPAVAWNLRLHLDEVQVFPFPPGTLIAGRRSWLALDPRFDPVARSAQWRVLRRCVRG